ncbi:MAG: hypothetical protein HRU05_14000 [Oceanospirillaceae bacterium]|nr:hypothetical protein [Oceanospirillaceae bacterium]
MKHCCQACQTLITTGTTHSQLVLLSEVTGSKIFKCHDCQTYMHFVLGVWEVFMASPPSYRKISDTQSNRQHRQ